MTTPLRVLLVDDEPHILSSLARQLRYHFKDDPRGIVLDTESDPVRAMARIGERAYGVLISDYRMPKVTGVEVLACMRSTQPHCTRIMLSGQVDQEGLANAINAAQVHRFLAKPWSEAVLVQAVEAGLRQYQQACEEIEVVEQVRFQRGELSPQEAERRRLERLEPGLTHVEFDEDGAYVLVP